MLLWIIHEGDLNQKPKPLWLEYDPSAPMDQKKTADESKNHRIVNTPVINPTQEAAKHAYLGQKNQRVQHETVSHESSVQKPGQIVAQKLEKAIPAPSSNLVGQVHSLRTLGVPILPPEKSGSRMANRPADAPVWAEEGSTAKDYITGLQETEQTLLNTKEYVFFGYFQRIRERLELAWHPLLKNHISKIYSQGRSLASEIEHLTRVLVTLSSLGEVVRVQVMEESGVVDLDTAAIEAFNHAGPFPNPPKGLIGDDGRVEIRWDFVLKT